MPPGPGPPDLPEPAFGLGPLPVHYLKINITGDNQQALFESQPIRLPGPAAQQHFKIKVTGENGEVLSEIDKPRRTGFVIPELQEVNPDEHFVIIRVGFEGKEAFDLPVPKSAPIGSIVRSICGKIGKDTADVVAECRTKNSMVRVAEDDKVGFLEMADGDELVLKRHPGLPMPRL